MSIESQVLEKIRPTNEEIASIEEITRDLENVVLDCVSKYDIDIKTKMAGSFAKGTFLSNPDIDLFILFPESTSREDLENVGLEIGEKILLDCTKMYSEHPYTRGVFKGLDVDLVPGYNLEKIDGIRTAVDRTPFHTDYILSKMTGEQKDQVRLLKKFMKGIGTYGAEPNIRGFSGYLCELLILYYGDFTNLLNNVCNWKEGTVLIIEKKGPSIVDSLIVYDPVDVKRNVASAVHIDTLSQFIVASKAYLECPSIKFFFPNKRTPLTKKQIEDVTELHGSKIITTVFKRPDVVEDNIHSQLWKTQYALTKKLNEFDYNVLRALHKLYDDTLEIVFEIERDVLSKTHRHIGPPVWMKHSESFLLKWRDNEHGEPFIDNGSWCVISKRIYSTAQDMIKDEITVAGIGRNIDPYGVDVRDYERSLDETELLLLTELIYPIQRWNV